MTNNDRIKKLAQQHPTAWFESIYFTALGNPEEIPWAKLQAHPLLTQWLDETKPKGREQRALVIGCGLGDDAEILAEFGYDVTAFDISPTAIAWCRERFPNSSVNYIVADLLTLPSNWKETFDLVIEVRTIQSLPLEMRKQVLNAIAALIKPQGLLLLITNLRGDNEPVDGPPWALSWSELAQLKALNLQQISETEALPLVRLLYQKQ